MTDTNVNIFKDSNSFHTALQNLNKAENIEQKNISNEVQNEQLPKQNTDLSIQEEPTQDLSESIKQEDNNISSPKETNYIPRSRFNEINEAKKQLEEQILQEREKAIRLEEQVKALNQFQQQIPNKLQPQFQEEISQIDPLDIEAHKYYDKKIKNLEERLEKLVVKAENQDEALYKQSVISSQRNAFERNTPDYQDAANYLANFETQRAQMICETENEINEYLNNELYKLTNTALRKGINVAQHIYEMAKKAGYNSKSKEQKTPIQLNGANLEAINNNMPKSASINTVGNGIGIGGIGKINSAKQTLVNPKNEYSAVDPKKFHEALSKV